MTWKRVGIFFLALGGSIAGLAQTGANLTPPVLLMPVCAGLRELAGVTPLKLGRVQVTVNGRDVGERTVTTGQFALSIPALKVNQFVEVTFRYKDTLGKERSLRSTYDVSGDGVCKPAEAVAKAEVTKPATGKPIEEVAKPEVAKGAEPASIKKTEDKSSKAVNEALSPVTIKALVAGGKKIAGTTPVKKGKITAEVGGVETESVKVTDAKFEIDLEAADSKVKGLKENQEVAVTFTYEADGKEGKLTAKATVGSAPYTLQLLKEVVDAARSDPGTSCDPKVRACTKADKLTVTILKNGVPGTKVEGNGVIESYSLNPDGEKSELLQAKNAKVEKGRASANFGDHHIGGLYVAKVDIEGTVVSVELKDPSAGIVARGVDEGDDSLRANIAETLPASLIKEQGGKVNQNDRANHERIEKWDGGRGTERCRA